MHFEGQMLQQRGDDFGCVVLSRAKEANWEVAGFLNYVVLDRRIMYSPIPALVSESEHFLFLKTENIHKIIIEICHRINDQAKL